MKTLPLSLCLALVRSSEQELVDAFRRLSHRHSRDYEIKEGCRLFAQWSRAHIETLAPFIDRHGRAVNSDPGRVGAALFHGARVGGYGLLRDMQDLLLLVHQARTAWTSLEQAAKEMQDVEMAEAAAHCAAETDRQVDWVCTHVKHVAPQALTVPPDMSEELKASLPGKPARAVTSGEARNIFVGALLLGLIGLAFSRFRVSR